MDDGPITISIDLIPCESDADVIYAREISIIRYLAWLMGREIVRPGGSFELRFSQLRRTVRVVPQIDVLQLLQEAVVEALQTFEQKFWEELFAEEGEENCVYWAKLVGIYDPVHESIIKALVRRQDGDDSAWSALTQAPSAPPPYPAFLDFTSDDMTGFLMYFEDLY